MIAAMATSLPPWPSPPTASIIWTLDVAVRYVRGEQGMFKIAGTAATCVFLATVGSTAAAQTGPYAGMESRPIKTLSTTEIADYLSGKGMGFARAAELNHYPGPAHVLALASELG